MTAHVITEKDIEDGEIEELKQQIAVEQLRVKIMDEINAYKERLIDEYEAKLKATEKRNRELKEIEAAAMAASQSATDVQIQGFVKLLDKQLQQDHRNAWEQGKQWVETNDKLAEIHTQFTELMQNASWLQNIAQAEQNLKNSELERERLLQRRDLLKKQEEELISRVKSAEELKLNVFILKAIQLSKQNKMEKKRLAELLIVKDKLISAAQHDESISSISDAEVDNPVAAQQMMCTPPNVNRVNERHVRLNENPDVHLITPEPRPFRRNVEDEANVEDDDVEALSPPTPNLVSSPANDDSVEVIVEKRNNVPNYEAPTPAAAGKDSADADVAAGSVLGSFVLTSNNSGVAFPLGEEEGEGIGFNFGSEQPSEGMLNFQFSMSSPVRPSNKGDRSTQKQGSTQVAESSDNAFAFDFGGDTEVNGGGFDFNLSIDEQEGDGPNFFGF